MRKFIAILILLIFSIGCGHMAGFKEFLTTRDPWTKENKMMAAASTAAMLADMYTTTRFLNNAGNYEMNPLMGRHPSDARVIGTMMGTQLAVLGLAHLLPEKYRNWLLGGKGLLNTGLAVHNFGLQW